MVLGKLKHVKARLSMRHDRCFSTKKRVLPKKALNLKRIDEQSRFAPKPIHLIYSKRNEN